MLTATHTLIFLETPLHHLSGGNLNSYCGDDTFHKSKLSQLSVTNTDMSPWSPFSLCRSYLDKKHCVVHVVTTCIDETLCQLWINEVFSCFKF